MAHYGMELLLLAAAGQAQDNAAADFSHARFVDGKRPMLELVRFPDIDFDIEVDVTCSGRAT